MLRASLAILIASIAAAACDHSPSTPSCTYALSATPAQFGAEGGAGTLTVTTQPRCSWTARAEADWVTLGSPSTGTGTATVTFTVATNPAGADRSTSVTVSDQAVAIRQSARACEFSVSPDADSYGADGGRGTVTVDAAPGCQWTATSSAGWLQITAGATGSGSGTVEYAVSAHDGDSRDGTLTVAGRVVNIHQEGRAACTFAIAPSSQTFDAAGGSGTFDVDTGPGCEWSVRSDAAWVRITAPGGGAATGPGRVAFTVDRHESTEQRVATIVAGTEAFTVVQRGSTALCEYGVEPVSFSFHWHGTDGQNAEIRVSTGPSCGWTASAEVSWLPIVSGSSGTGSGAVRFRVGSYIFETTRRAPIMVRWPTPTAGQNVWVTQEGCYYAVSTRSVTIGPEGGRTMVTVFGTPVSVDCRIGCPWTATTATSWIHITTPMPSSGDNEFFFNVDANSSGVDRTGEISVAGSTVMTITVTQRGR